MVYRGIINILWSILAMPWLPNTNSQLQSEISVFIFICEHSPVSLAVISIIWLISTLAGCQL
jgi:hypothetical protein